MKEKIIKLIKICFIVITLEVIVFNINSYRTFFGNYTKKEIPIEDMIFFKSENGKIQLEIKDINLPVATLKLVAKDMHYDYDYDYDYTYFYSDETTSQYIGMTGKTYVSTLEKTKYMPCFLSGKVKGLILEVDEFFYDLELIEKVVINEKIPFEFNYIRVLICIFIFCVVEYFKKSEFMNSLYDYKNYKQELILCFILAIFIVLLTFINMNSMESITDNIYNKNFVEALAKGSFSLLEKPSQGFLELQDPYDAFSRNQMVRNKDFFWDSAYYNGNFYIYFGILPILTMFLPYFLLTGKYLKCATACYILSIGIIILLKEVLYKIYKLYFKNIPFKLVVLSLITLYFGSLILYVNGCVRFYEIAIVSGVYCILQGIYFILKSIEIPDKKYRYILLGCLFMALSVACRPTSVLASLLIVPYLLKEFIEHIKNRKGNINLIFKFIFSVAVPYLIVAIPLMWYNYVRFDSVFEFGAKYQLTINNMIKLGSRLFTIPVGLLCNLFSIPSFIPDFPFIINHNQTAVFYGYYYIENMIGGLFILSPICFACFYLYKVNKKMENKELKNIINMLIITAIIIATISVAMAGSTQRYLFDYAWMFVLAGILIFNFIYSILKTQEAKTILMKIMGILTVYTVIIGICSGIVSEKSYFKDYSPETFYKVKYSVCFWE